MSKQIIINSGLREKRAALLVNNSLEDLFFERDTYDQIVHNIYRGRVRDVLPGMQAAFIDIGIEKNAFLHISDTFPLFSPEKIEQWKEGKLGIQHILQPGQEIMVQVIKEPIGTKGPKVTCKISLPGRYLVLLPYESRIGISRRITDHVERDRLKKIAGELTGGESGIILRTNSYQKKMETIKQDFGYLINLWSEIQQKYSASKAPTLVYKDVDLIKQIVRDYLAPDIDKVVVDQEECYNRMIKLARAINLDMKSKIYYYDKKSPIFAAYGIEKELNKALKRKVWLDSGGYVIFDSTEALVAVDVNTGKYTGKKNLQETVFKTNLEAASEIARQLRLRDIGGIIIIDFIDMSAEKHREEVLRVLREELDKDRTKTALLGITQLGLVEMTRKKVREGLGDLIQKECPYCQGTGKVYSETTMALKVISDITDLALREDFSALLIELHPRVAAVLIGSGGEKLLELEENLNKEIYIVGNNELHIEEYNIVNKGSRAKLLSQALPVSTGERYKIKIEDKHVNNNKDGIARIKGYIIIVAEAGQYIGEEVEVEIAEIHRTFARAKLVNSKIG